MLYGGNFGWEYSPSLLLFSHPSSGYASVSMVDIAYPGFSQEQLAMLDIMALDERLPLLKSVSQSSTQWSVVYDYSQLSVQAAMGPNYKTVHTFQLKK